MVSYSVNDVKISNFFFFQQPVESLKSLAVQAFFSLFPQVIHMSYTQGVDKSRWENYVKKINWELAVCSKFNLNKMARITKPSPAGKGDRRAVDEESILKTA